MASLLAAEELGNTPGSNASAMPSYGSVAVPTAIPSADFMDGAGFKARLKQLGRTQVGFAGENKIALRTVHNWAAAGPPEEVVRLLDLLVRLEKPFEQSGPGCAPRVFGHVVATELERLAEAAGTDRRADFRKHVEEWLSGTSLNVEHSEP